MHWLSVARCPCKVNGAKMGPIWGWQDPGGPHVGRKNLAIWSQDRLAYNVFQRLEISLELSCSSLGIIRIYIYMIHLKH